MSSTRITDRRSRGAVAARAAAAACVALVVASCSFDRGERWVRESDGGAVTTCKVGEHRCVRTLEVCKPSDGIPRWETEDDCASRNEICSPSLLACARCEPQATRCDGTSVERCASDGSGYEHDQDCTTPDGTSSCRDGKCVSLCRQAAEERSNVGCEYWAADLDNADIDDSKNAAAQQFAVVVSNPQPDLAATVTVEQDDTDPGTENQPKEVVRVVVPPLSLRVLKLGPREVDGSPRGEFNTGTNTALTRAAYRVKSTVPVISYQFNPLDNVNVFSNDASLLKPVEALMTGGGEARPAYVVLGWPQTIAITDDPNTNFSTTKPINLRAFLTIVGTRSGTHVRVHTTARIVKGGVIPETAAGDTVELSLEPFDVANLETEDFKADFTGSVVETDQPVVVFSGTEASDAPAWDRLATRQCCADHLEEQLDPIRTAGKHFVATISPNRTDALVRAGATTLGHFDAPEFFRVVAATDAGALVRTTLPEPYDRLVLNELGDFAEITATDDFYLSSDQPVSLASVSPSQEASGVPSSLPGGDPSLVVIPPVEQYRPDYVFLTPDKYAFDFVRIVAPTDAKVALDGDPVDKLNTCKKRDVRGLGAAKQPLYHVYECQLAFPVVNMASGADAVVTSGIQNDGVHQVQGTREVGVIVDGFDKNVSYAYAGGTELTEIVPR